MLRQEQSITIETFKEFKTAFSSFLEMYDNKLEQEMGYKLNPIIIVHWVDTIDEELEAPILILN